MADDAKRVRALLAEVARLRGEVLQLGMLPGQMAAQAKASFDGMRLEIATAQMGSIPVARLKETAKNLRLRDVEQAGIRTLDQLLAAGHHGLVRIPNVGPDTASKAIAAALQVLAACKEAARVRFDIENRPAAQAELLDAVRRYDWLSRCVEGANIHLQWLAGLEPIVAAAEPAGRAWGRRLLGGRQQRATSESAAQALAAAWASPPVAEIRKAVAQAAAIKDAVRNADEIWKDYETYAAQLLGILGEITGVGISGTASHGELTEEIIKRVEAQALDRSFLSASLRGYQAFGAKFALAQRRTILGDEMGLGKTIEALAVLCHLRSEDRGAALVVCPASVVANWRNEIRRHSELIPHVIHGPDRDRARARWEREGGVGITTFDHLKRLTPPLDPAGIPLQLPALIVDEAHYVKNPRSQRARAVNRWAQASDRVIFLSGTPMENRVDEFRNLVHMLQPTVAQHLLTETGIAGASAFRTAVAPAYLRRNQVDVLDELPDRIDALEWVDATPEDLDLYRNAVGGSGFMAMRRAAYMAAHPDGAALSMSHVERSAKLDRLVDIIEAAGEGGLKVIVFSFFRDVLDLVTLAAKIACPNGVYGPLTGSVAPAERQAMVERLTDHIGPAVLTAQIEAGGTGLNIQAASVVVLCEPQWKPTIEAQAVARAHRMGQVRKVQVHRLLIPDGVDEHMLRILAGKSALFDEYVTKSPIKDLSPEAIDVSDLEAVQRVASEAEAERQIVEAEKRRLGFETQRAQAAPS